MMNNQNEKFHHSLKNTLMVAGENTRIVEKLVGRLSESVPADKLTVIIDRLHKVLGSLDDANRLIDEDKKTNQGQQGSDN